MTMSASRDRHYYLNSFNARLYLEQFYGSTQNGVTTITNEASGFIFSALKNFLRQCDKGEGRLLDIGTGPCLANVIPAAQYFSQIYCADLSPLAREELVKWRAGRADAFDWTSFFKFSAQLDQRPDDWRTYEVSLRDSIKAIWPCDMTEEDPLAPEKVAVFDVVTESFMLGTVANDANELVDLVRRLSRYLKPGGTIIITESTNASFYQLDGKLLYIAQLNESDYVSALEKNGFSQTEIVRASDANVKDDQEVSDIGDDVVIKAIKTVHS